MSEDALQEIVDALSVRLGRPVLVDDVELRPLAYSSQFGELDTLRTASILGRAAPDWAREVLFGHGIRGATEPVHIPPHAANEMEARLCIPILRANRRLGYLWLLEDRPVEGEDLDLARTSAAEAAEVLQTEADTQLDRHRHEQELLTALLAGQADAAAATLDQERYLPQRPGRGLRRGGGGPARPHPGQARADRRARGDRRRRTTRTRSPAPPASATPSRICATLPARIAARSPRCGESGVTRWDELRAQRLLSALPPTALGDLPDGVRALLDNEQLAQTLETYLDHAGDVKQTAAELWLHRTSLYYRLRRIEEIAGVDLNRGEDRLLCHVALRLAKRA